MGHSYYGDKHGPQPDQHDYEKKFAWWPVVSNSKKRVWLKHYYIRHTYYDNNSKPPLKGLYWDLKNTKNEYLMMLLKWK